MLLRTRRQGVGSAVGHDLTLEVTNWTAQMDIPDTGPADAAVTARIDLDSLVLREASGGAKPLTDKDRDEIHKNAQRMLDVGRHRTASFESTRVVVSDDHTTISGVLTLHGVAAPVDVDLREVAPNRYRAATVVTQSAYGITPYSAFLGALKVRDDVEVETDVDLGA
jgi:polyisoprenoid-binding protein YceI